MRANISLGRWFGIPVGLHYSWFVVAWLITLSLAGQFSSQNPGWTPAVIWTTAVATALLFFGGIVLHELSHATVARFGGVPVRGITLFALGGVAQIERDAATARKEFWIAIAGPIMSLAIGLVCRTAAGALGWTPSGPAPSPPAALLGSLGYVNLGLALFNLIPGYPLDGGRVLRALVWGVTGSADRATRIATRVGQFVAFLFIAVGLFAFTARGMFGGLWIAFIGWFLLDAALASHAQVGLTQSLRGIRVADIMTRECARVEADTPIQTFVEDHLLRTAGRCFAVTRNDRVVGLITPHEVKVVQRERWPSVQVSEVMRPIDSLRTVRPDSAAADALTLMSREDVNQLPVVANGHLEGVVARSHILQLLQLKAELRA